MRFSASADPGEPGARALRALPFPWPGSSRRGGGGPRRPTRATVVAEVRRIIAERYVLPERRPALDAILARGLASGRYDVADPGRSPSGSTPISTRPATIATSASATIRRRRPASPRARRRASPTKARYERQARAANHGISELRVLPGNVRYLDL